MCFLPLLYCTVLARVAGRRKEGKSKWAREGEGTACKDAIDFRPPDEC